MSKISVVLCVLTPTPFLRAMTEFTIKTLRCHADNDFELVVVEAAGNWFEPSVLEKQSGLVPGDYTKYLNFTPKIGCVRELNEGLRAASGDFVVCTGNDVIVPPHWDTELLRCFEERQDCGVASLSAFEPGAIIGPPQAQDRVVEGMYSPFMMFRAGERMDEDYVKIYQDSDFVMRVYERGQRAYRSCRAHVHHLLRMTSDRVDNVGHNRDLAHDERLFYQRWGRSPLAMFGMIRAGHQIYGREHEAFVNPINLHYDPSKPA
jgi:GT2 family glycosyltransferase